MTLKRGSTPHHFPFVACLVLTLYLSPVAAFFVGPLHRPTAPCLRVVADAHDIDSPRQRRQRDDKNPDGNSSSKAWTKVKGGMFLPNFPGKRKPNPQKGDLTEEEPMIRSVDNIQEYKKYVVEESNNSIVVVRFYAPWCRACKAVALPFRKLAHRFVTRRNPTLAIKFVEVPLTKENAYLHEGLGVPSMPYGHIYYPRLGLVEERKLNRHVFADFERVLEDYDQGYCDVPGEDGSQDERQD